MTSNRLLSLQMAAQVSYAVIISVNYALDWCQKKASCHTLIMFLPVPVFNSACGLINEKKGPAVYQRVHCIHVHFFMHYRNTPHN